MHAVPCPVSCITECMWRQYLATQPAAESENLTVPHQSVSIHTERNKTSHRWRSVISRIMFCPLMYKESCKKLSSALDYVLSTVEHTKESCSLHAKVSCVFYACFGINCRIFKQHKPACYSNEEALYFMSSGLSVLNALKGSTDFNSFDLVGSVVTTRMCIYHQVYQSTIPRSAHIVYLCVLCGYHNKQRLFPYTGLTDWFV
jgi:hypothetical protein